MSGLTSISDTEKWLDRRLTKRQLVHLVVSMLRPPKNSGTAQEWVVNSVLYVTKYQRRIVRGSERMLGAAQTGRGMCGECDTIAKKLTEA